MGKPHSVNIFFVIDCVILIIFNDRSEGPSKRRLTIRRAKKNELKKR